MTQVKLPTSKMGLSPPVKIAAASLFLLLAGAVLFVALPPSGPKEPQVRGNDIASIVQKKDKVDNVKPATNNSAGSTPHKPGVHRYEMSLAQLVKTDDHTDPTGTVVIETHNDWAPIGAAHFHDLVTNHFYNDCRFFRVVDNFVVQFGINGDPAVQRKWRNDVLKDDPVKETNAYGTLTYATSGPNTRTVQLFINTSKRGNGRLDAQGFAPFGRIVSGMEHVARINNEYREKPNQGKIQNQGNDYLNREFPRLSYIASVRSLDEDSPQG